MTQKVTCYSFEVRVKCHKGHKGDKVIISQLRQRKTLRFMFTCDNEKMGTYVWLCFCNHYGC